MPQISRSVTLPKNRSFFLVGPRGVGKSTLLGQKLTADFHIDLLRIETFLSLSQNANLLEAQTRHLPPGSWVVIDEVQKLPMILSEVHYLIEKYQLYFALTGSSARKLKAKEADLLAGRAIYKRLEAFSYEELGAGFDFDDLLQWGGLPLICLDPENRISTLNTYVHTYLKQEIQEEGIVRKLNPFLRFLEVAGILNGQQCNNEAIAREAKIARSGVDGYFAILEDTLVGFRLPAFQPKAKVREQSHPKFYWFDSGVARAAAGLLNTQVESVWLGFSLETWIYHELRVYLESAHLFFPVYYYRLQDGQEIDFVIELQRGMFGKPAEVILIEVKLSSKWNPIWNRSMLSLADSGKVVVKRMIGVYRGSQQLGFDRVEVFPVQQFIHSLFAGQFF